VVEEVQFTRTIQAEPEHVGPLRRELTQWAEHAGVADPGGLAIAVSEVLTNAVIHAFTTASRPGSVSVTAVSHPDDGLEVRVCDDGHGMRPRPDSPGVGLGLSVVAQLTERFDISTPPEGGTDVRMVFGRT
jgi:anti-sigma regulatory factor (Ser/Thr protein kinase)